MDRNKKLAVAMAAVSAYIQAEEEAALELSTRDNRPPAWCQYGRQAQAEKSNLLKFSAR